MNPTSRRSGTLYALAALVATATLAVWLFTGAHWGWTRTHVTEMQHDEVTGIDFPVRQEKFVAGVEVLGAGAGLALLLGGGGFLLARRRPAAS